MNSFPIDIFSVIFFGKSSKDTSIYLFFFFGSKHLYISCFQIIQDIKAIVYFYYDPDINVTL